MAVTSPPKKLIEQYMVEIARTFDVPFTPDESALMVSGVNIQILKSLTRIDLKYLGCIVEFIFGCIIMIYWLYTNVWISVK